ncbi:DGUOK protein, partial [Spelaeornis formosus]|nr:DGUOK protein [Elachura formosa]
RTGGTGLTALSPAVGKSTFLRLLAAACPRWHLVPEPLARWRSVPAAGPAQVSPAPADPRLCPRHPLTPRGARQGPGDSANLLQMMYREPARWSYTFQSFSCLGRLKAMLEAPDAGTPGTPCPVRVFERSVFSDRYSE